MPTSISEYLSVTADALEAFGVFDAFVDLDSQLHVDPRLLTDSSVPEMQEAREAITKYFDDIIALLSLSDQPNGPLWDEARKRLVLNELKGVSLGYSKDEADGSVGPGLARTLAFEGVPDSEGGRERPARLRACRPLYGRFWPRPYQRRRAADR